MEFSTDIEGKAIHLYCWQDGHKVSDYVLSAEEARSLAHKLLQAEVYVHYEIARGVKPYGKAPLIESIESTDKGVVVKCKLRD